MRGRPPNPQTQRRISVAKKYNLGRKKAMRLTPSFLDQLDNCADDRERQLLINSLSKKGRRPCNPENEKYKRDFHLSRKTIRKLRREGVLSQVQKCADDTARRIILGVKDT